MWFEYTEHSAQRIQHEPDSTGRGEPSGEEEEEEEPPLGPGRVWGSSV